MNIFAFSNLLFGITCFYLAAVVFIFGKEKIHRIWGLFNIGVGWWGIARFFAVSTNNLSTSMLWWKIAHIGGVFTPVFLLHAVYILGNLLDRKRKIILFLCYLECMVFQIFLFTNIAGNNIVWKFNSFYYPTASFYCLKPLGIDFPILVPIFLLMLFYAMLLLYRVYRNSLGESRRHVKWFLVAEFIGWSGSTWYFLPVFNINWYPYWDFMVPLYCAVATYAILKHRLLDIEVIIKKTLVFASLLAIVFGVFISITLLMQELIAGGRLLGLAISSVIIIFAVRPIEDFLIRITDKYLFQKKYNPIELIRTFSKVILTELDLNKITKSTVEKLVEALKLTSCVILIPNREGDKYIIRESYGVPDKKKSYTKNSHIISYLGKVNSVIVRGADKSMPEAIMKDMDQIGASACLAIMIHKQLIGVLCLGKKKSDQEYTKEDMDTLLLLADALGVAITNALAFEDIRQKEKLAAIGMLAAGIKHDIGTPLNQMSASVQSFLIEKEDGEHQKKPINEILSDAYNLLTRCQMTFTKISRISAKFADFAKPKRKSEMEVFKISESIDEALGTLDHEIQARNISIKKDIQEDLTPIMADREYMQEIFFNIIRNAAQAIEETHKSKKESAITITVREKPDKHIVVEIKDTGGGISEDGLQKIFEPYYTTKDGRGGTGLGLAIVSELVERNGGKISVNSELGKGTAFVLEFQGENA